MPIERTTHHRAKLLIEKQSQAIVFLLESTEGYPYPSVSVSGGFGHIELGSMDLENILLWATQAKATWDAAIARDQERP